MLRKVLKKKRKKLKKKRKNFKHLNTVNIRVKSERMT